MSRFVADQNDTEIDSPKALIGLFGSQSALAEEIGATRSAVSMWVSRGAFPADWFHLIEQAVQKKGASLSRCIFNFRQQELPSGKPTEAAR